MPKVGSEMAPSRRRFISSLLLMSGTRSAEMLPAMHVMFLGMRSRAKPRPLTGLPSEGRGRQSCGHWVNHGSKEAFQFSSVPCVLRWQC